MKQLDENQKLVEKALQKWKQIDAPGGNQNQ
jgi:hypothetical protein